jgi:two-component system heavy metal sensor histidine kinase CusS
MKIRSLTVKLALLVGLLSLAQTLAVLAFSYKTVASKLAEQRRQVLTLTMAESRQLLSDAPDLAAVGQSAYRLEELLARHNGIHAVVARPGNLTALIAFSPTALESLARLRNDTWGTDAFLQWKSEKTDEPMLSVVTVGSVRSGEEYILMLTADRSSDAELLSNFLKVALGATPLALILVSLGAWAIVMLGLKPLNRFREAAVIISAKNIPQRLNPAGMPLELLPLCRAFNDMLDRLEDGIQRLSQFSGDLAHEMRTPLATLLGRTQVVLSQPRTHEQLVQLLEDNVEEFDRLTRIVADMLFLAQADSLTTQVQTTPLNLADEARKIGAYLEILAQERNITFHIVGEGTVFADVGLVDRAITNLLSNAVRYGEANSIVEINVESRADVLELAVINTGQQIPSEHVPHLFDRFYRADAARSREQGGTGLGLSIVRAIMFLHGGTVGVESRPPGITKFSLRFPKNSSSISS